MAIDDLVRELDKQETIELLESNGVVISIAHSQLNRNLIGFVDSRFSRQVKSLLARVCRGGESPPAFPYVNCRSDGREVEYGVRYALKRLVKNEH